MTLRYQLQLNVCLIAAIWTACAATAMATDNLPAFPGAEGFGAIAKGGRGGRVIKVTNLDASGPGSFQAACAEAGPRIVIFDVAGVIRGDVAIRHSNITVAGQSAPSPGITLVGRLLARPQEGERLKDVVVRFLRVRPPPTSGHTGDAVQLPHSERVILDHLSLSWANDEMIDIIHSSEVTVQWSTIEESDPTGHDKGVAHNFAILSAYPGSGNVSIHHNLFAHHSRRLPSLSPGEPDKPGDFRNNVVYNYRDGLVHDGHKPKAGINLIGNYYKRGPDSETVYPFQFAPAGNYFVSVNYFDGLGMLSLPMSATTVVPGWMKISRHGTLLNRAVDVAPVHTHAAQDAYRMVMSRAGTWPRDRVTKRTLSEVVEGTGKWGRHASENPTSEWFLDGMPAGLPEMDSDGDGIPDRWERKRGLNAHSPADNGRIMKSGYSAVEEYLNERAQQRIVMLRR